MELSAYRGQERDLMRSRPFAFYAPLPGPSASEIKGFAPISEEQEVCPMAEEKKYYIRVRGALVQVTAKVYKSLFKIF